MTITPDTALGGDLEFLTREESARADELRRDSENAVSLTEVGLALGGAFLFYRLYMVKRLRRELRPAMTGPQLAAAVDYHFRKFIPIWSYVTLPAMVRAMVMSSPDAGIPDELVFAMADDYARRVGMYLNETSKEALLEGFNAYTNKRQNRVIAGTKALDGFGLTKKQTRAMVAKKDRPPVASTRHIPLDRDRELYAETAVFSRALNVGDNEAYAATQHGKQIGWMYLQREGRISVDAKRVWITARDEKTCKVCGPMHRKSAKIDEPFETDRGEVWSPGLHPNCRCTMTLRGVIKPSLLRKDLYGAELAEFNRKVRRDDEGKFSFKPKVKEREPVDPRVEEMLRQAEQMDEEIIIPSKIKVGENRIKAKVSIGEKVTIPSRQGDFDKPVIPKATIPKHSLEKVLLSESKIMLLSDKVAIDRAALRRPSPKPSPKRPEHKDLGYEATYYDGKNTLFSAYEPIPSDGTKPVLFRDEHAFYDGDTTAEMMEVGYDELATQLAKGYVGASITNPDTGKTFALGPTHGKRVFLALLKGEYKDGLDEFAEQVRFNRYNHVARVYHTSTVYPDGQHEAEGFVKSPGPYVVEAVLKVPDQGLPIEHVYLRPMTADEYQAWYDQREHQ